jgi:hypothetical protein
MARGVWRLGLKDVTACRIVVVRVPLE